MLKRVRIKSLAKAKDGGVSYNQLAPMYMPNNMGLAPTKVKNTLTGVPRDQANLEAEGGETALVPSVGGLPAHFKIQGNRHTHGGVPLNLPNDSFIFSDTRGMIIKDPEVLAEFDETKPKTPAQIAKKYDLNKYREILADPDMDKRSKDTAEKMIANYSIKLGKLAAYQEAMKGFDGGIPVVAMPYLSTSGIKPEDILPLKPGSNQGQAAQQQMNEEENPTEDQFENEQDMPEAQFGGSRLGQRVRQFFNRPRQFDPRSGIYMQTDNQGRVFYVDGNGTQMPANINLPQGFMRPGTVVSNTTTTKTKTSTGTKTIKVDKKIPKDAVVVKRSDYKTDAEFNAARDKAYNEAKDKNNVYTVGADGKNRKIVSKAFKAPDYKGTDLDKAFKGNKEVANRYQYIEDQLLGNEDLQKKLYDETIKELKNPDSQRAKQLAARGVKLDEAIKDLTPKKVTEQFLQMQKRNIALQVHHGNVAGTANSPEGNGVSNKELMEASEAAGLSMPDATSAALQQAAYRAMHTLASSGQAAGFEPGQVGAADEPGKNGNKRISPIDAVYTNTTAGQIIGIPGKPTIGEEDLGQEDQQNADEIETTDIDTNVRQPYEAEPWLQDVVKTAGAFGDLNRIKKYSPWAPKLDPYMPEPTFYDPTRELAAVNEQMAIGAEGAGAFAPAQAYNARQAEMQGQGAKSVADVLGRYNNLNVGTANQFELTKANLFNTTGLENANIAKNLYDSTMIANQQYDNSKAQARQELRQSYIDLITNRAQAQAMNETYGDHYMVDPSSGGYVTFTGKTKDLEPSYSEVNQNAKAFRGLKDQFPEVDDSVLIKLMGSNPGGDDTYANQYMKALASMYPAQTGAGYGSYYEE